MALLNLDLGGTGTTTISEENADQDNTLDITALGDHELIVDGVNATVNSVAGIQAGASPTYTVTNGGNFTLDQGLINASALNGTTFGIEGESSATLDASSISGLNGLNSYDVDFSGEGPGSFTFNKPDVGLLDSYNFNVTGAEAGDQINLGGGDWSLDEGGILNPQDAYRDGALHLTQGNAAVGTQVNAAIEMSQEDYEAYLEDPDAYLNGDSFTYPGEVVCFAKGTMIATPDGEVAVESLAIGDMLLTDTGEQVPVKWVGRQSVRNVVAAQKLQPVRIKQGALGEDMPNRDLVVTASHGMVVDGLVINAAALVNGSSIDFMPWNEMTETVTYYHIETEGHKVIIANGTESETYIDYVDRKVFDNYAEYEALYGAETRVVEMPRPRISSRRQVPMSLRQRLGMESTLAVAQAS
ncbi:Hint domain-containing protein [Salinicola corii]|uniref:Hint domain-containing protein n=1 Tax=Salinicola corii TaxID=2606937 RepID=A0A640WFM8_9GAMM|nr:Hint domain-containing protein [Salinicola corii]KAA0019020.1 Hint domain-containing protein [Salinicola corii]